jgi:MoxR-like ATPase
MRDDLPWDITREVVGPRAELRLLLGAIKRGEAMLLVGLPGVSKTTMLRSLARHLGSESDRFIDVTGDEQPPAVMALARAGALGLEAIGTDAFTPAAATQAERHAQGGSKGWR